MKLELIGLRYYPKFSHWRINIHVFELRYLAQALNIMLPKWNDLSLQYYPNSRFEPKALLPPESYEQFKGGVYEELHYYNRFHKDLLSDCNDNFQEMYKFASESERFSKAMIFDCATYEPYTSDHEDDDCGDQI